MSGQWRIDDGKRMSALLDASYACQLSAFRGARSVCLMVGKNSTSSAPENCRNVRVYDHTTHAATH